MTSLEKGECEKINGSSNEISNPYQRYIIVSADPSNYRGKVIGFDCINRAGTIGHEIHISRPILIFLLSRHLITTNDIIVTKSKERFFLYSEIFKNIIEYNEMDFNMNNDLICDITHLNSLLWPTLPHLVLDVFDIEQKFNILKQIRTNDIIVKTELYNDLVKKINYIDIGEIQKNYIVIHHRLVKYDNGSNNVNETMHIILKIFEKYPDLDIVLFTINYVGFPRHPRINVVSTIDRYASYMNHAKCKAVISQFSGGGQLSQYCHNKFIFYYHKHYGFSNAFSRANSDTNIYNDFDYKKNTNANVFMFNNYIHLSDNIISDSFLVNYFSLPSNDDSVLKNENIPINLYKQF